MHALRLFPIDTGPEQMTLFELTPSTTSTPHISKLENPPRARRRALDLLGDLMTTYKERRARRRAAQERERAVEHAARDAEAEGLEPITPHDLQIIRLALEDRMRDHHGTPAGEAATRVREKIARNMTR